MRAILRPSRERPASLPSEVAQGLDRRVVRRSSLRLSATTKSPVAGEIPALIRDISQGGFLLEAETEALSVDEKIDVELPGRGLIRAKVAWCSRSFFGCQFIQPIPPAAISAALLKSEPQDSQNAETGWGRARVGSAGLKLEPQLNFSAACSLAIGLWVLIGLALYIALV
jgi:hypothetical protein